MANANIELWGIKKLAFALFTNYGTCTYDTPVVHPGAVSLAISTSDNDANRDAADNGIYYDGSTASNKTGELEVAKFSDWFKENALGFISEAGGLGEGDGTKQHFAMLFETDGDQGGERFVWYDCTSSDITQTLSTTDVDGNYTFAHETATITGRLIQLPNGNRRRAFKCDSDSTAYEDFFTAVFYPAATQGGGE